MWTGAYYWKKNSKSAPNYNLTICQPILNKQICPLLMAGYVTNIANCLCCRAQYEVMIFSFLRASDENPSGTHDCDTVEQTK